MFLFLFLRVGKLDLKYMDIEPPRCFVFVFVFLKVQVVVLGRHWSGSLENNRPIRTEVPSDGVGGGMKKDKGVKGKSKTIGIFLQGRKASVGLSFRG